MHNFILSCESTADLPYSYMEGRNVSVLFYSYIVEGKEYVDDMGRDANALPMFYEFLANDKFPKTSQINEFRYYEYFEQLIQNGNVLHIAFGSGLTPSVNNAFAAAERLKEKYPDRTVTVIDSFCGSSGYGMLVDYAADMRDAGKTMEETAKWIEDNCKNIHHQFFSTNLKFFRKSGRISGAAATVATILSICPLMHLDNPGKIIAYGKTRGKKNAINELITVMQEYAAGGTEYSGKCFISHSESLDTALILKSAVEEKFPNIQGEILINDIGTVIAAHSGPGTVALYFLGDRRV